MKTHLNFKQITKNSGLLLIAFLLGGLFFGCSSSGTGNTGGQPANKSKSDNSQATGGGMNMGGMNMPGMNMGGGRKKGTSQAITLSPVAMKIANVATTPVVQKVAVKHIRMPGKVAVNQRKDEVIPAYFPGRIEELYVNFTGAYIRKGDKLASVYAPKLITAQKELLQAYNHRKSNPALYRAARQKLKNWELSDRQIDAILQSGEPKTNFIIRARQSGYVLDLNTEEGDYIKPGKPLLRLADLSNVWVVFQAFENELASLDTGDKVKFKVEALPGRTFEAEVTFISPVIHSKRRTVSVRTEISNKDGLLKPNMLAEGNVSATLYDSNSVLQVPKSAVLWTGKHSIVWVKKAGVNQPTFKAREVVLGPSLGNSYVILKGLKAGEQVVVQGNFMIDAAAQLAGKKSMMIPEPDNSRNSGGMPGMPAMKME